MKTPTRPASVLLLAGTIAAASANADSNSAEFHLSLRLRNEYVSDAAFARPADAGTLRTRLSFKSPRWAGWTVLAEVDDVRAYQADYNSTRNGHTDRPIVADPIGTDLNIAAVEWQKGGRRIVLGRQRANLDNQRFIGSSGWRQNEQTFDGATVTLPLGSAVDLHYAGFYNVNRVYGPSNGSQRAEWHGPVHALYADLRWDAIGTFIPYAYSMDFHNSAAQSNRTAGIAFKRTWTLGSGWTMPVRLDWAQQSNAGDNPTSYSAHYSNFEAALVHGPVRWQIGRETLGGDATRSNHRFQTPLATLHIFDGWVDKFLTTPPQGVEDTYVSLSAKWPRVSAQVSWHDLRAAAVTRHYGDEIDGSLTLPLVKGQELLVKGGRYRAADYGTSTTKLWLQWQATF